MCQIKRFIAGHLERRPVTMLTVILSAAQDPLLTLSAANGLRACLLPSDVILSAAKDLREGSEGPLTGRLLSKRLQ